MKRRGWSVPFLWAIATGLAACSGAPSTSGQQPGAATTSAAAAVTAAWEFTVTGNRPVPPNGSQDTATQTTGAHAAGESCDTAQLVKDQATGKGIADGFAAGNLPAAAALLRHFLAGLGTGVSYQAGSQVSKLALASAAFQAVNEQVQAAITKQLRAGGSRVLLTAGQLPTVSFDSGGDLYWGFRGTQGLTVTGGGSRAGGRYVGTLTYVIRDSYGFPAGDTLAGFGPPMRYLQTVCGAPQHAGGARWFPDTITVTVPFSQAT
jgi:hypothetical protein